MQCSKPLHIYNRKLSYQTGVDRPVVSVNCGKCLSCRQMMQNEWILRAYFHYKYYTEKRDGLVFFVTLTYNDDAIPYIVESKILDSYGLNYSDVEVVRGIPNKWYFDNAINCFSCFNKRDIDKFFNSVRQHLKREFNILDLNYLCACEYGSKNSIRPHYHLLIYVPDTYLFAPTLRGKSSVIKYCRELFEYYWTHVQKNGWTIYSPVEKGGACVQNATAIKYVGKYITKDLDFWSNEKVKNFFLDVERRKEFKHNLPRHWQSKGFGSFLCDYILDSADGVDILEDGYKMPMTGKEKRPYYCPIPSYNRRKILYDTIYQKHYETRLKCLKTANGLKFEPKEYVVTDHTFVIPNNNYFNFSVSSLQKRLDKTVSSLEMDLSFLGLQKYFTDRNDFVDFIDHQSIYKGVKDFSHFSTWLKSLLGSNSILDLSIYKLVYRGNVITTKLDGNLLGNYLDNYKRILRSKCECSFWKVSEKGSKADKFKTVDYKDTVFCRFELILGIVDKLHQRLSNKTALASYKRYLKMRRAKQLTHKL